MLAEAAVCVALATVPSQELKKDFEAKACANHLLRADLKMEGDHLDLTFTVNATKADLLANPEVEGNNRVPMATVEAANLAWRTASYVKGIIPFESFQWTIQDKDGKYLCSIHVEGDVVNGGDCAGLDTRK